MCRRNSQRRHWCVCCDDFQAELSIFPQMLLHNGRSQYLTVITPPFFWRFAALPLSGSLMASRRDTPHTISVHAAQLPRNPVTFRLSEDLVHSIKPLRFKFQYLCCCRHRLGFHYAQCAFRYAQCAFHCVRYAFHCVHLGVRCCHCDSRC